MNKTLLTAIMLAGVLLFGSSGYMLIEVVAIKRDEGDNPNPETTIMAGDTLVVLGEYEKIKELEKVV